MNIVLLGQVAQRRAADISKSASLDDGLSQLGLGVVLAAIACSKTVNLLMLRFGYGPEIREAIVAAITVQVMYFMMLGKGSYERLNYHSVHVKRFGALRVAEVHDTITSRVLAGLKNTAGPGALAALASSNAPQVGDFIGHIAKWFPVFHGRLLNRREGERGRGRFRLSPCVGVRPRTRALEYSIEGAR